MSSKISVITPVLNGADHLRSHYNFVSLGLSNYDFQIIYVDNNSLDDTLEVLNLLADADERVLILTCEKRGAAPARNAALNVVGEGVLIFVDVDDIFLPGSIAHQIEMAHKGIASYCYSLVSGGDSFVYPCWNNERSLNFWLSFGNQGALSSFVAPVTPVRFYENLDSSEDWLYVVQVRQFINSGIALAGSFGRIYNAGTGYSHSLQSSKIRSNHILAYTLAYDVNLESAGRLFDLLYANSRWSMFGLLEFFRLVLRVKFLRNMNLIGFLMTGIKKSRLHI